MINIDVREYKEVIKGYAHSLELKRKENIQVEKIEKIGDFLKETKGIKYGYANVDFEEIKDSITAPFYSRFDDMVLVRNKDIFLAIGTNIELNNFLRRSVLNGLEVKLSCSKEKLSEMVEMFLRLEGDVYKKMKKENVFDLELLKKLNTETEILLPFLTEHKKMLEQVKELVKHENFNGVFRSLVNEVDEGKMYTLETMVKTSSNTTSLFLQHCSMQMNLKTQESLKKVQEDSDKGIKEIVSLEKAIECIYLVAGTYYITHLTLLFLEYYHESNWPILYYFNPLLYIIIIIFSSFSLAIVTLLCFPKVLEKLRKFIK